MSEVRAPTTAEGGTIGAVLRRWMVRPEAPALVFLAVLVVAFSLSSDKFLSGSNLESIVVSVAVLGTIALAVNQVILCGEIDISTGSMMGRSEEHTSELQSRQYLVCRLLLEKK